MLSGETAAGKYPVESIAMMDAIVKEAEQNYERWGNYKTFPEEVTNQSDALSITRAARELAHDRDVAAVAVFTESGRTARFLSKARPRVPIKAFTPNERTYQAWVSCGASHPTWCPLPPPSKRCWRMLNRPWLPPQTWLPASKS
jgi:pyruvate kinase